MHPSIRSRKKALATYLPPNPVIVEAGAHDGTDTADFARLWPGGRVYAFEPVPVLFERLQSTTAGLTNVTCFPVALANENGIATLHVSGGESDGSSSLLRPTGHLEDHPGVTFEFDLQVPTITLDTWLNGDRRRRPDLLWLDLQGAEYAVLSASPRSLAAASAVYCEVSLHESYAGGALYSTLRAFMESAGFLVAREELFWKDGGNVLFVRGRVVDTRPAEPPPTGAH